MFTLATIVSVFCAHRLYDKILSKLTLQTNNLTINKNKIFWTIIGLLYFYAIIVWLSYRHCQSNYIPFLHKYRFSTDNLPASMYGLFIHPYIVEMVGNVALFMMFLANLNKKNVQKFFLLEKHNFLLFVVWVVLFGLARTNPKSIVGYLGITWILFLLLVSKKTLNFFKILLTLGVLILFAILSFLFKGMQVENYNHNWRQHLNRLYIENIRTVPFLNKNFYYKYNKEVSCSFWDYIIIRLKNDETKKHMTNVINGIALLCGEEFSYKYKTGFQYSLEAFLFLNYGLYSIFYWFFISFLLTLISRFWGKFSAFLFVVLAFNLLDPLNCLIILLKIVFIGLTYFCLKRSKILVAIK